MSSTSLLGPRLEFLEDRMLPAGVGAIGDSITIPYFGRAGTAHNWVEELVDLRGVNFGGLSSSRRREGTAQPNGSLEQTGRASRLKSGSVPAARPVAQLGVRPRRCD
jgi:hypothetical protein